MQVRYRPIGRDWVGDRAGWRKSSPFRRAGRSTEGGGWQYGSPMPWSDTLLLLDRELMALGADEVIFQLDMAERDIRLDGMPRADARPSTPAVILSFESRHGHLRYQCDTFDHWQANVRAIGLGLEALRKVDRYGISARGEQYKGWVALPDGSLTREDAKQWIAEHGGSIPEALKRTHPDHGGNESDLRRTLEARKALEVGA